ncbi:hypothetical protein MASR2M18_04200 [Ignavibacteria bacterium]|nr:hypothetical protein [Bacteroidota bacterium]MCZ2133448.1 hypothetical protein [Bacteroidota bacterium]
MIELAIFYLHFLAALYAFTKRWQAAGLREGLLGALIFGLAFIILWSLAGPIAQLLVPDSAMTTIITPENVRIQVPGYASWFTQDTMSITLAAIPDAIFFYMFFLREKSSLHTSNS